MSSEKELRELVREMLVERKIKLLNGSSANYGSKRHIKELDRMISMLDQFRRNMGRKDRKERYTLSRSIDSLRHLKRKAERASELKALIDERDKKGKK
tara:strand:- start:3 stop:296 length:294 start_codon:yes stop_codon:yes gene_type:complete